MRLRIANFLGCSSFSLSSGNLPGGNINSTKPGISQFADNPSVYTRLSCFLPWVAEQYGMIYNQTEREPQCDESYGDIEDKGTWNCSTKTFNGADISEGIEPQCIFPFYLNGVKYTGCTFAEIKDFSRPLFICPIRTLKNRGNNYETYHANIKQKYCPTNVIRSFSLNSTQPGNSKKQKWFYGYSNGGEVKNEFNNEWELDPENEGCTSKSGYRRARPVFATCRNTCPGGENSGSLSSYQTL